MNSKTFSKPVLGVFAVLALVGIGCWVFQLANGLAVTGMSNANSWGLYICTFMLFVGLSAGGLIVASSTHVFGIESFKGVAKPAVICSTACICVAGMLVPFLVLAVAKNREKRGMIVLASALVVLGVACKRVWLLFTSFIHPNVYGGPGITSGTFAAQQDPADTWMALGSFAPTIPECLVTLGVISARVLSFRARGPTCAMKGFPMSFYRDAAGLADE